MDAEEKTRIPSSGLSTAAIAALYQGNKIEAIKITRQERNIGLKEAKDAVEEYVRQTPAVGSLFAESQSEAQRRALWLVVTVVAIALLVYYFVTRP